jgi:hypothetical protein
MKSLLMIASVAVLSILFMPSPSQAMGGIIQEPDYFIPRGPPRYPHPHHASHRGSPQRDEATKPKNNDGDQDQSRTSTK